MKTAARLAAVLFSAVAMFSLLLGLAAVALGRPERAAVYAGAIVVSVVIVAAIMRREFRSRRAAEALLPVERRPVRRMPRSPIVVPLKEAVVTFAVWYAVAVAVDRVVTGSTALFTLAAVAPFAAFMLTTLTVAGRHMMFRLTAEEVDPPTARTRREAPDRSSRPQAR